MSRRECLGWVAVAGAVALLVLPAQQRPHADLQILTHRAGDIAPQKVQAAVDFGVVAVSVLVTWSRQLAR